MSDEQAIIGFFLLGAFILCLYFSPEILDTFDKYKKSRQDKLKKMDSENQYKNPPIGTHVKYFLVIQIILNGGVVLLYPHNMPDWLVFLMVIQFFGHALWALDK